MKIRFRPRWLLPFAAMAIVPCLILFLLWEQYRPRPSLPDAPPHIILSSDSDLTPVALLDFCIAGAVNDEVLIALDHELVYLHSDGTPHGPYIRRQGIHETTPLWQSVGTQHPFSMAIFEGTIFLTLSIEAEAYSLTTGELLWRNQVLPGHTGNVIASYDQSALVIYYTVYNPVQRSAVILTLDPQSGSLLERMEYPLEAYAAMVPYAGTGLLWMAGQDLWLSQAPSAPPVWRLHAPGMITGWPLQYQDMLIVSTGFFSQLSAIRLDTGEIIWEDLREFVSLPTVFRGLIYAISKDAQLVALDPATGYQVGSVQFSPLASEEGSRSYLYTVAASEHIIAVYFGDSCQLFVLVPPAA